MKAKKTKTAAGSDLQAVVDRQMDMLRSYKQRQDAIVLDLSNIRREITQGSMVDGLNILDNLLATDLKQSKDRVDNLLLALKIAVDALEKNKDVDVLSQIELIAPREMCAFTEPVGMTS